MLEAILFDFDGTLVDFVQSDIEGAKAAGLMTLLLTNGKNKQSEKTDYAVKSITALIELLEQLTSQPATR